MGNKQAKIYYHDIGDYLSSKEKLKLIKEFGSYDNIPWQKITPDQHGDWLDQRDDSLNTLPVLGDKKQSAQVIFALHTSGVKTNRDSWAINFDRHQLAANMAEMIGVYNHELQRLTGNPLTKQNIDDHIELNAQKIKWSRELKQDLIKGREGIFSPAKIRLASYRPFTKQYLYYCKQFNSRHSQTAKTEPIAGNFYLCVTGVGAKEFSVLMTDCLPNHDFLDKAQCFPLYYLDDNGNRQDSITDWTLTEYRRVYQNKRITKEQIFYYIYALLHAGWYQAKYRHNLTRELPRIPYVDADDFKPYVGIGRKLATLHLNYEQHPQHKGLQILYRGKPVSLSKIPTTALKVKKMRIAKDMTSINYNEQIVIANIPATAWKYQVNGYAPMRWIVERYQCKTDKDSRLLNDPNAYSDNSDRDDRQYILRLLISSITVAVKTQELCEELAAKR